MSDAFLNAFVHGSRDEAEAAVAAEIDAGRSPAAAEVLVRQLAGEGSWRRERILERLRASGRTDALLPHLAEALQDPADPERRNAARSALSTLASPGASSAETALATLGRLLYDADDPDVRILAATALGESENPLGRAPLEALLDDAEPNVRSAAAEALGLLGDGRAVPALSDALDGTTFWTRAAIVFALGRLGEPGGLPALGRAVHDPLLASTAAAAIGEIGAPQGLELLRPALAGEGEARAAALDAIAGIYGRNPGIPVPGWLRSGVAACEGEVLERFRATGAVEAARLLGIMATPAARETLLDELQNPDHEIVAEAGLSEMPAEARERLALEHLDRPGAEHRAVLLRILPPLSSRAALERVAALLSEEDPETRAAAADVLARSDREQALDVLVGMLEQPGLRLAAATGLGRLGTQRCHPLLGLLRDSDPRVRTAAAQGLARCPEAGVADLAGALVEEEDAGTRGALITTIGELGGREAVTALTQMQADEDVATRFALAQALGRTAAEEAFAPLMRLLDDPAPEVRIAALNALGELGDARASQAVELHLREEDRDMRRTAARALERLAPELPVEGIASALEDDDREVRRTAVAALARIGGPAAAAALEARLEKEPDAEVRGAASRALLGFTPPAPGST